MNNRAWLGIALCILLASSAAGLAQASDLRVSPNGRYLLKDGKPFFYLCDTAWNLFLCTSREEADEYLKNRSQKGFNVIMALLIGERPHPDERNAYGEPPLIDRDPFAWNGRDSGQT